MTPFGDSFVSHLLRHKMSKRLFCLPARETETADSVVTASLVGRC